MKDAEPDRSIISRPRVGLALVALTLVLGGVLAYWAYQRETGESERFDPPSGSPGAQAIGDRVGTSGSGEPSNVEGSGGSPAVPPAIIQELETITGSVDGQELIGRRVDLHVIVQAVPNEVAFWTGQKDNRVLVVLSRGNRNGTVPPRHRVLPVHAGQYAAISGSLQRLPKAEEMDSWRLTGVELAEALDRKIYIRADTVTTNGHGSH